MVRIGPYVIKRDSQLNHPPLISVEMFGKNQFVRLLFNSPKIYSLEISLETRIP